MDKIPYNIKILIYLRFSKAIVFANRKISFFVLLTEYAATRSGIDGIKQVRTYMLNQYTAQTQICYVVVVLRCEVVNRTEKKTNKK